jgi:hypothetical protein
MLGKSSTKQVQNENEFHFLSCAQGTPVFEHESFRFFGFRPEISNQSQERTIVKKVKALTAGFR